MPNGAVENPVSAMWGGAGVVQAYQEEQAMFPLRQEQAKLGLEQTRINLSQAEAILNIQKNLANRVANQNKGGPQGTVSASTQNAVQQQAEELYDIGQQYMYFAPEMAKTYYDMAGALVRNQTLASERELSAIKSDMQIFSAMLAGDPKTIKPEYVKQQAQRFQAMRPEDAKTLYGGLVSQLADGTVTATPELITSMQAGALNQLQLADAQLAQMRIVTEGFNQDLRGAQKKLDEVTADLRRVQKERLEQQGGATPKDATPSDRKAMEGALGTYGNVDTFRTGLSDQGALDSADAGIWRARQDISREPGGDKLSATELDKRAVQRFMASPEGQRLLPRMKWAKGTSGPPPFGPGAAPTPRAAQPATAPPQPPAGSTAAAPGEGFTVDKPGG